LPRTPMRLARADRTANVSFNKDLPALNSEAETCGWRTGADMDKLHEPGVAWRMKMTV